MAATNKADVFIDPNWKNKYPSLEEFYNDNYPDKYFDFEKYEFSIDPLESKQQIEAYSSQRKELEIKRCALSFNYFCHKYVKITHPKKGLLPFITYKYQRRAIQDYDKYRFNIISKFRQGGLTTVTVLWAMWRCLFRLDETIMVVSKTDREAIAAGEIVKRALEELPEWMKPETTKNNDHQKIFSDTGCKLFFCSPEAARGRSMSYLIIDEAAFIQNMNKFWNDIFPTVNTGGNVIVISTVNGVGGTGGWYHDCYKAAEKQDNDFHIIDIDYTEHPEYDDPKWVDIVRAQLGEKGFAQEILRDFLGAGDSYISEAIINDLEIEARKMEPLRILFKEWANKANRTKKKSNEILEDGALIIWREPIEGREYIMGVDAAQGLEEDNSCFQIIDAVNLEQVAEFYSNTIKEHIFAQICAHVGTMYNTALIVVESEKCGLTVLSKLEHDLHYENLYFTDGKYAGIKTTSKTKPLYLETLQTRLITKTMIVRSRRFIHELKNFIYNKATKKVETHKGYHDDAILAMCICLYVRDLQIRTSPIVSGGDIPEELTEKYKAEIYEDIKKELNRDVSEDWFFDREDDLDDNEIVQLNKRPYDSLLREFNW
jgi:hypothetical protein